MKTNTPVTATYNHMGKVHLATFLCFSYSPLKPLYMVNNTSGTMIADKTM